MFISGLTVLIAMAGMLFTGNAVFTSIAVGAMLMVAVALIGSLSILPALLSKLEHRVDKGRIPILGRRSGGESRVWGYVLDRVLRRPALAAALSGGALLLLALPVLTMHTQLPSFTDLPKSLADREDVRPDPGGVPGRADAGEGRDRGRRRDGARRCRRRSAELKQRALASGQMFEPVSTQVNPKGTVETVSLSLAGDGSDEASVDALQTLRHDLLPGDGRARGRASRRR